MQMLSCFYVAQAYATLRKNLVGKRLIVVSEQG